jgi:cation diffusion facilitator CzcD-associated flavoprotein CzcO
MGSIVSTLYGASKSKTPDEVPVLIVGGGPTGLLQAILLAKLGGMFLSLLLLL